MWNLQLEILVSCGSRRWDGFSFFFFKEKEAVSPEYGSGINAFESFEAFL